MVAQVSMKSCVVAGGAPVSGSRGTNNELVIVRYQSAPILTNLAVNGENTEHIDAAALRRLSSADQCLTLSKNWAGAGEGSQGREHNSDG